MEEEENTESRSTASSAPVANTRGSRIKPKGAQGTAAQGPKQLIHLEDVVIMMAWEILTIKQKVDRLAEVCEGWCAKQQEKDEGTAHPWACSKRGGCVISLLNKAAIADTLSAARNTESHSGWSKVGFAEMAKCKPAVWDSVIGSFKPIHPKHKEDKPWTWVATIRSDAPSQNMEQFRAMTSLHTERIITIAAERENKQEVAQNSFKNHLILLRRLHDGREYLFPWEWSRTWR